jgi:hypothetical protein
MNANFDHNRYRRMKLDFLKLLYRMELKNQEEGKLVITTGDWRELGNKVGASEAIAHRIVSDLSTQNFIELPGGRSCNLTKNGRDFIESQLHEESLSWIDRSRRKLNSPAIVGGIAGGVVSLIVSILTASDVPWWVKMIMERLKK